MGKNGKIRSIQDGDKLKDQNNAQRNGSEASTQRLALFLTHLKGTVSPVLNRLNVLTLDRSRLRHQAVTI
jgi:hypothetical protein